MAELTDQMKAEILQLIKDNLEVSVSTDSQNDWYSRRISVKVSLSLMDGTGEGRAVEFSSSSDSVSDGS
jgi:hypothetical protein